MQEILIPPYFRAPSKAIAIKIVPFIAIYSTCFTRFFIFFIYKPHRKCEKQSKQDQLYFYKPKNCILKEWWCGGGGGVGGIFC